jgi:acyl-CoA thioester hydrolase
MSAVTVLTHRVRYHEVDQQGVMFNARFLEVADVAQIEYFRVLGWDLGQLNALGFDPAVVHVEADFRSPARYDDFLDISVACLRVGTSSLTLNYTISRGATTIATLTIIHVNVDSRSSRSVPLPEELASALQSRISDTAGRENS